MKDIACRICGKIVGNTEQAVNYHDRCMKKLDDGKADFLPRSMYITK